MSVVKEGWTYKRFDEVFDLQMGKTPDRKVLQYFEGPNVWVSIRDLTAKEISDSNEHISDTAVDVTNIRKVKKGTVIMSFKLTVGKCAIAARDLYTNEAIMAFNLRGDYDISSDFLFYYLTNYKWEGANKAVMGITLNKATISRHKIGYPSSSKQKIIVSELDKINELIALKKSQLKDLDTLAQSIFYEMFGDPITNEKGWEVKKLGEVCDVRDGTHDSPKYLIKSDYVLVTSKNIQDDHIDFNTNNFISREDYDKINQRSLVNAGDIIMAMIGTVGKPIIVPRTNVNFCVKNVAIIKFNNNSKVINIFIKSLLDNSTYMQYIQGLNKGGTQKFVALGTIRSLSLPLPPLSLQHQFAERVESIERMKQQVQTAIKDLETLLASRMQYWFD